MPESTQHLVLSLQNMPAYTYKNLSSHCQVGASEPSKLNKNKYKHTTLDANDTREIFKSDINMKNKYVKPILWPEDDYYI